MKDNELDELLRAALLRRAGQEADEHRSRPAPEPSPAHRRWERKFLAAPLAWARQAARPVWRRAACAAAAVLLVFSLAYGVSPTVRAWMQQAMIVEYEEYATFTFEDNGNDPMEATGAWYPTWVPKGYEMADDVRLDALACITYKNEMGQEVFLSYTVFNQNFNIDNEHHKLSLVKVNGETAYLLSSTEDGYNNSLIWADVSCNLVFYLDGDLSSTKLIRIAESVAQK